MYCLDELDRKKVKYPHLTDLAAGKIGRQEAAGFLLIIIYVIPSLPTKNSKPHRVLLDRKI